MLDILRGTPLWVYAVFFIVTYYGVIACFKNRETKKSLLLTPAIFVAISVASLKISQGFVVPLSVYAMGLLVGWLLALRFYSFHNVKREGEGLVLDGTIRVLIVYWCVALLQRIPRGGASAIGQRNWVGGLVVTGVRAYQWFDRWTKFQVITFFQVR